MNCSVEVRVEYRAKHPAEEAPRIKRIVKAKLEEARRAISFSLAPTVSLLAGLPEFLSYQRSYRQNQSETLKDHERAIRFFASALSDESGDIAIDAIQITDIDLAVEKLLSGRIPGTVNKYLASLKQFGRWAAQRKSVPLTSMPWLDLDRVKATASKRTALTSSEFETLMRRWPESGRHVAMLIWMMIFAGSRPGALRTLQWRHLRKDGETGFYLLSLRTLKGGKLETISFEIGSAVEHVLNDARGFFSAFHGRAPAREDFIFVPSPVRGKRGQPNMWSASALSKAVRHHADMAMQKSRVELSRDFVAYMSRHSILTWLARDGVSDELRARYVGHTTPAMQKHYVHLSGEDARPIRDEISDRFGKLYDQCMGHRKGTPENGTGQKQDSQAQAVGQPDLYITL
jgi:integrase